MEEEEEKISSNAETQPDENSADQTLPQNSAVKQPTNEVSNEVSNPVPQTPYVKLKQNESNIPIQPNQNFRPRFQRWPNHPGPRWNQNPNIIPRGGPMGPNFNMRPMRPNQFFNNFPNPLQRPMQPQRFPYKPNEIRPQVMRFPPMQQVPPAISSNVPGMPRKVLINPNFKGGVEAAKSK